MTLPYFQNFDTLTAGQANLPFKWEQSTDDDLDWILLKGTTPSRDGGYLTGPAEGDYPNATGTYIYIEASNNNPSKKGIIITPKFNFQHVNKAELQLFYHMYSSENVMGNFYVDVQVGNDGVWEEGKISLTNTDYGDRWNEEKLDLAFIINRNYTAEQKKRVRFRFRGITSDDDDNGWCSDICIDNFKIDGQVAVHSVSYKLPKSFDLKYYGSRIHCQVPEIDKKNQVSISIYNLQGKLVKTVIEKRLNPGNYSIPIQQLPNGMYMCRMETKDFVKTINLLLSK